jgi:hypothetical protein
MTYKGYGDGGYGSSSLMAELLGRKGFSLFQNPLDLCFVLVASIAILQLRLDM